MSVTINTKLDDLKNVSSLYGTINDEIATIASVADKCSTNDDNHNNQTTRSELTVVTIEKTHSHVSTLTDLYNSQQSGDELEITSLIEEQIPKYKLRARVDDITKFAGDESDDDWHYIKTPLINIDAPIDLSPETISETLKYFLLSSARLSQMTKTYNDIDAVTKLLEEKEKDLELAAKIGQSLLDQNKMLINRNEELEAELLTINESMVQIKHELSVKNGLLQIYNNDFEDDNNDNETNEIIKDKNCISANWDDLYKKVNTLEVENSRLRNEAFERVNDIDIEEKKELQLIQDCTKQLTEANLQILNFQDEVSRRTEDNIRQQDEITSLLSQLVELQRTARDLNLEIDTLKTALSISHDCQNELSSEIIEIKEKYGILLSAFHELQSEFKKRSKVKSSQYQNCSFMPYCDSLASEIESSLGSEGYDSEMSGYFMNTKKRNNEELRCYSPDSVLSNDSVHFRYPPSQLLQIGPQRLFFLPDKLQIVKPLEGSVTLKHWQKLATPHLGVILEQLPGVPNKAIKDLNSQFLGFAQSSESYDSLINSCNNFVTTCSIFTYTTTSLSQTTEATVVTPSFTDVQLSTGLTLTKLRESSGQTSSINVQQTRLYADSPLILSNRNMNIVTVSSSQSLSNETITTLSNKHLSHQFNDSISNDLKSNINTSKTSAELDNRQNSPLSSPIHKNNRSQAKLSNLLENHSNTSFGVNTGLCLSPNLLDMKLTDGVITKCFSSNFSKSLNFEKRDKRSLDEQNLKNICDRRDTVFIKTLRKGGFV